MGFCRPFLTIYSAAPRLRGYFGSSRQKLADMKTTLRISIVAACYLLSSYGILLSLMLIGMSGIKLLSGTLVGLLILFAWVCHVIMSMNWVIDKPTKKWVPVYGTLAGFMALMLWPIADSSTKHFEIVDVFSSVVMGLAFTLPCFLLAIHLVRFHLSSQSKHESPYASSQEAADN